MANKKYIERLQMVIQQLHGSPSTHVETVSVHEIFKGKTVWRGDVEVFNLTAHPKAKHCYAWSYQAGGDEKFVAVLGLPPVVSPQTAVKAAAATEIKRIRKALGQ